jgi:hypothetical protein
MWIDTTDCMGGLHIPRAVKYLIIVLLIMITLTDSKSELCGTNIGGGPMGIAATGNVVLLAGSVSSSDGVAPSP